MLQNSECIEACQSHTKVSHSIDHYSNPNMTQQNALISIFRQYFLRRGIDRSYNVALLHVEVMWWLRLSSLSIITLRLHTRSTGCTVVSPSKNFQ